MLVIAHRGASAEQPENTLPAFERAIEIGADFIEFDVWNRLEVTHGRPSPPTLVDGVYGCPLASRSRPHTPRTAGRRRETDTRPSLM